MNAISISERFRHPVSRFRKTVLSSHPRGRLDSLPWVSAALAVASGSAMAAWAAIAPHDDLVPLLAITTALFVLGLACLILSRRWTLPPATFGILVSALASVGVGIDSDGWTLGFIIFLLASLHTAYFASTRGVALQLVVTSGSFLAALLVTDRVRWLLDWTVVTAALAFFSLAVLVATRLVDTLLKDLRTRAHGQRIVAQLGQRALVESDIEALVQETAAAAAEALTLDRVVIYESIRGDGALSMRAAAGSAADGFVPDAVVEPDAFTHYTLLTDEAVVVPDLARETRFEPPHFLLDLGIVSAVNVTIPGHEHHWGVLGARTTERRVFSDADVDFLRSLANVLGSAIEQRKHEQSLRSSRASAAEVNERLSAVIDASPVAIIEIDPERRVTLWNKVAEEIFGWTQDEVIGTVLPTTPPHRVEELEELIERAVAGEQIMNFETERQRRDGTIFPYSISVAAHRDGDGNVVGVIGLGTDLSASKQAEEALARERQLVNALLETTADQVYFKDRASRFIKISATQAERFGLESTEEAIGKTDFDFFSEEHARPAYEDEQRIIRTGEPLVDIEEKETWEDGREAWVSTTKMPLHDDEGNIIGTYGISRDITKRKRAEEELIRSRELYRVVVENSHDMIAVLDPMGRFVFASPSYEEALGYGPEELVDVSPISLVHPADVQRASDALRQAVTSQGAAVVELRMRHKRGSWVFVEGTTTSVLDENGELQSILMSFRDISERRIAEEELREAEARYRLLVEQLPLITYINVPGESGRWIYLSPQLEEILGYKPVDWTSDFQTFLDSIHPDDRERVTAERAASGGKGRIGLEYRLISKDGRTVWVRDEAVVVRDLSGKPLYVQGYLLDISAEREAESERRRLEAQLLHSQKMEAIGRLAGGIAHDFNNLLTAITGYSDLIVTELDPASSMARDAEEIKRAAEQAAAMTQQLLAFSRRQVLQPSLLNPNEVIEHMEKMLQRLIGENIELVTDLGPDVALIRSDRSQIEQVIMNLVVNARDAITSGGRITIETANASLDPSAAARIGLPEGDYVVATISDTGHGMDEETISHIFEPFFTTKEQGEGTGLGLATVHGIVEQSSGAIEVSSEAGEGSTFRIYLPVAQKSADAESAAAPTGEIHGSETLLLVEDEEMVRQLVARVLRDLGYEVFETSSGEEALVLSDSLDKSIDLLVTDVVMPGMSGRELAEVIAVSRPSTRVLFMSGYTDESIVHEGVLGGEADFIGKPFTPQELAHKIRSVLDASVNGGERRQSAAG